MEKAVFSTIVDGKKAEELTVQFNPQTYSLKKSNKTVVKSKNARTPPFEYLDRRPSTLSMELLFDSYEYGKSSQKDVRDAYKLLRTESMQIKSEAHTPPAVQFAWGTFIFVGVVTSLDEKYTMFAESGIPVRSRVTVTMEGNAQEESNAVPRHSPDRTKIRTVTQGETLWEISAREYGSPEKWRAIARANGIENPRKLVAAAVLQIPALPGGAE